MVHLTETVEVVVVLELALELYVPKARAVAESVQLATTVAVTVKVVDPLAPPRFAVMISV